MLELIVLVSILFALFMFYKELYPIFRKCKNRRKEREMLVKKYNRLWKCRNEMLVILLLNMTLDAL